MDYKAEERESGCSFVESGGLASIRSRHEAFRRLFKAGHRLVEVCLIILAGYHLFDERAETLMIPQLLLSFFFLT